MLIHFYTNTVHEQKYTTAAYVYIYSSKYLIYPLTEGVVYMYICIVILYTVYTSICRYCSCKRKKEIMFFMSELYNIIVDIAYLNIQYILYKFV